MCHLLCLAAIISSWAVQSAATKHENAVSTLLRLHILIVSPKASEPAFRMNKAFQQHVRTAVCSGRVGHHYMTTPEVLSLAPSQNTADAYAAEQWDRLLLFAVGGGSNPDVPALLHASVPLNLSSLLLSAGLISIDEEEGHQLVTQGGFQFLLSDTYTQLWTLLRAYIARAEQQSGGELSSVLGFLLQLGHQSDTCIPLEPLSPTERDFAAHMAQLGALLPFRAGQAVWLRPTRLAVLLAGGGGGISGVAAEDGFVVAETNFRVYAYTSSPVRQAILRLFVRCEVLLPNLFVGTITRDSVIAALDSGVGADQILGYLRQHAHPRIASRSPVVPTVVSDQVRLWQREISRLGAEPAVLYTKFEGADLFTRVAAYADKTRSALVRDDVHKQLVAAASSHESVKAEIKKLKNALNYGKR
jgi:transcription initiation factor TFIIH subunit 4